MYLWRYDRLINHDPAAAKFLINGKKYLNFVNNYYNGKSIWRQDQSFFRICPPLLFVYSRCWNGPFDNNSWKTNVECSNADIFRSFRDLEIWFATSYMYMPVYGIKCLATFAECFLSYSLKNSPSQFTIIYMYICTCTCNSFHSCGFVLNILSHIHVFEVHLFYSVNTS